MYKLLQIGFTWRCEAYAHYTSETWYLPPDEITALHARYSVTQDRRIADRILCVLLKAEKHWEHPEIATFLNVSSDTVTDWLRLYLTAGLDRL